MKDYYDNHPQQVNIDNMCIIRGKPTTNDFTNYYRILDDGTTQLSVKLRVVNKTCNTTDYAYILVYGHVKDETSKWYKNGGMAERLLKKLSSKCDVTFYCHVSYREYVKKDDTVVKKQLLVCDTYRTESKDSRMQAIMQAMEKKKALEEKYKDTTTETKQKEGE